MFTSSLVTIVMEVQLKNVLLSQMHSIRQKPEFTRVPVEYTVDTSEYGILQIAVLICSCVKYKFRLEVTNTIKLTVTHDVESTLMKILHDFRLLSPF